MSKNTPIKEVMPEIYPRLHPKGPRSLTGEDHKGEDYETIFKRLRSHPITRVSARGTEEPGRHTNRWQLIIEMDRNEWVTLEMLKPLKEPDPEFGNVKIAAGYGLFDGKIATMIPTSFSGKQLISLIDFLKDKRYFEYQLSEHDPEDAYWLYLVGSGLAKDAYYRLNQSENRFEYGKVAEMLRNYIREFYECQGRRAEIKRWMY